MTRDVDLILGSYSHPSLLNKVSKVILLSLFASTGLVIFVFLISSERFSVPRPTDFAQDYAMGRAILEGKDPYASLDTLTREFGFDIWHHPCPHPPTFAIMMAPLGLLSYGGAKFAWLLLSEIGLLISLRVLFSLNWISLLVWFLISLLWYPVQDDLSMGQLMTVMLMLLVLGWASLRSGRQARAGIFIGLALSVKLIVWPLIIYLLIKRKFRAAASAAGFFVGANLIAGIVMGFDRITYYYLHVGALVASIYRGSPFNYSIFSLGPRLFSGTRSTLPGFIGSDPLVSAPHLATLASALFAIAVLGAVFYFVIRCRNDEHSFAAIVCLSVVLSPTAWWFYFVLLLIPISVALKIRGALPKIAIGGCLVATYLPTLVQPIFGIRVSFWIGLLMLCPLFAVGLLIVALSASHPRDFTPTELTAEGKRQSHANDVADRENSLHCSGNIYPIIKNEMYPFLP